jgi:hypothetical protein
MTQSERVPCEERTHSGSQYNELFGRPCEKLATRRMSSPYDPTYAPAVCTSHARMLERKHGFRSEPLEGQR